MNQHAFSPEQRKGVYRAIAERRDMRHFISQPIDPAVLQKLLNAAHQSGSVGLMQPWRFIRITNLPLKNDIYKAVEKERKLTALALKQRHDEFMKLKVEGIKSCAELIVVALSAQREKHIFGRRTLPEMDLASTACAIQNMWLAARAEGIGMGWVSLFDPTELAQLLNMPSGSKPIAILCLGHVEKFYDKPLLEIENWAHSRPLHEFISENSW